MSKYSIGYDFGTLSVRALMINLSTGAEVCVAEKNYPHGVIEKELPCGRKIPDSYALQHPVDYIDCFKSVTSEIIENSGVKKEDIVGIGIDFTSCTVLATDESGKPMCLFDEFKSEPHSYVKLWKHHGANNEADEITELARSRKEKWLESYGGKVSSEWMFPKIYETYKKAPRVFSKTAKFMEAADWLVFLITGKEARSSCMTGFKAMWSKKEGYPKREFFEALDKGFAEEIFNKISVNVLPTGQTAGFITKEGAELSGLSEGTAVCVPIIDAHASLPAAGIVDEGRLMLIIGTSGCHIVMSEKEKDVPGICGSVKDGIIEGLTAYEAGQTCVGDSFDWFVRNCVPESYAKEAKEKNISTFALLEQKAMELEVGQSGLLALDWWNGNRTPYADFDLTGAILGFTLKTKPEDIYRALIESVAYGTKAILDLYRSSGVEINEIYASGGISQKNRLLMQIYADVLGEKIIVNKSQQSGALGVAVFASVAGGYFKSIKDAAKALIKTEAETYIPDATNTKKYERLYKEYVKLSKYFAEGANDVLKNLKEK